MVLPAKIHATSACRYSALDASGRANFAGIPRIGAGDVIAKDAHARVCRTVGPSRVQRLLKGLHRLGNVSSIMQ